MRLWTCALARLCFSTCFEITPKYCPHLLCHRRLHPPASSARALVIFPGLSFPVPPSSAVMQTSSPRATSAHRAFPSNPTEIWSISNVKATYKPVGRSGTGQQPWKSHLTTTTYHKETVYQTAPVPDHARTRQHNLACGMPAIMQQGPPRVHGRTGVTVTNLTAPPGHPEPWLLSKFAGSKRQVDVKQSVLDGSKQYAGFTSSAVGGSEYLAGTLRRNMQMKKGGPAIANSGYQYLSKLAFSTRPAC